MTLATQLEKRFDGKTVRAYCQTCGDTFLVMSYMEYMKKKSYDITRPDRWYCEGALHWLRNQEHLLVFEQVDQLSVLSEAWRQEMLMNGSSTEEMIRNFSEYLEKNGKELQI